MQINCPESVSPFVVRLSQREVNNLKTKGNMQTDKNLVVELETPRFEDGKLLLIAGLRERLTDDAVNIPALWQRFVPYIGNVPGQVGHIAYGVSLFKGDGSCGCEYYLAGVEVSDFSRLPDELSQLRIPAHKYAVFPHLEHVSRLWNTIDAIGRKWLPNSGYEVAADAPGFFERYGENFDPQTGTGGMEVWMPIKV
jgi:AraC family transcriptional regulator